MSTSQPPTNLSFDYWTRLTEPTYVFGQVKDEWQARIKENRDQPSEPFTRPPIRSKTYQVEGGAQSIYWTKNRVNGTQDRLLDSWLEVPLYQLTLFTLPTRIVLKMKRERERERAPENTFLDLQPRASRFCVTLHTSNGQLRCIPGQQVLTRLLACTCTYILVCIVHSYIHIISDDGKIPRLMSLD